MLDWGPKPFGVLDIEAVNLQGNQIPLPPGRSTISYLYSPIPRTPSGETPETPLTTDDVKLFLPGGGEWLRRKPSPERSKSRKAVINLFTTLFNEIQRHPSHSIFLPGGGDTI